MIRTLLKNELTVEQQNIIGLHKESAQGLLKALEKAIINNDNGIGLPYWSKQDPVMVKTLTFGLATLGYATVTASRKFSRLEFNMDKLDKQKLYDFRVTNKLRKFLMKEDTKNYSPSMVKSNGTIKETGLVRKGFAKVAKNTFKFDQEQLQRYYEPIRLSLIKSMIKAKENGKLKDKYFADEANFEQVVDFCLHHYLKDGTYNLEYNVSDSRGRSIYNALKRVANPIASKDFRALLVKPKSLVSRNNVDQMNDIYYFIAELLGSKAKTEATKIAQGKRWYGQHKVPTLDLNTDHGREELHVLIWLERIYTALDRLYSTNLPCITWDIPLEVDASMSIAQFVGALTNDKRLLERTNVIGTELTDPWHIDGVRRLAAKSVGTPTFYGSSQSATSLIQKKGLEVCKEEIKAIRKEFGSGGLAIMRLFKDAIIQNYTAHTPVIPMKIWNDEFNIEVNKFKPAGADIVVTQAWTGKKYQMSYTHEPILVPDYKHMKLFWATCLIHNLDSQVMDDIAYKANYWMLTIHDAILAGPGDVKQARKAYALRLKEVNKNRNKILMDFRESIGATTLKADIAFMKLYNSVQQADDCEFNATAMK